MCSKLAFAHFHQRRHARSVIKKKKRLIIVQLVPERQNITVYSQLVCATGLLSASNSEPVAVAEVEKKSERWKSQSPPRWSSHMADKHLCNGRASSKEVKSEKFDRGKRESRIPFKTLEKSDPTVAKTTTRCRSDNRLRSRRRLQTLFLSKGFIQRHKESDDAASREAKVKNKVWTT